MTYYTETNKNRAALQGLASERMKRLERKQRNQHFKSVAKTAGHWIAGGLIVVGLGLVGGKINSDLNHDKMVAQSKEPHAAIVHIGDGGNENVWDLSSAIASETNTDPRIVMYDIQQANSGKNIGEVQPGEPFNVPEQDQVAAAKAFPNDVQKK